MVHASATVGDAHPAPTPAHNSADVHLPLHPEPPLERVPTSPPLTPDHDPARRSPRPILASSLRLHNGRLRVARVRAEFEQTLLTLLALNVIYMYYIDHKLIVLFIRACQVIRLLHFPYASQASQRGTAVLLLVSNLPVLVIHKMLFTGPSVESNVGEMLFINFVGPEPKSLLKVLCVDLITIVLEAMLLQCKWEWEAFGAGLLTALPVPIGETLMPAEGAGEAQTAEERGGEEVEPESVTDAT